MERFIADEMLGTVARWLRILGFDTLYAKGMDDSDILEVAEKDDRIILTRDRELHGRALRRGIESVYLESADLEKDLGAILEEHRPDPSMFMSRCTLCNTLLKEVSKDDARGRVPEGVYERHDDFRYCPKCDKFYWEGSHHERMREFLERF